MSSSKVQELGILSLIDSRKMVEDGPCCGAPAVCGGRSVCLRVLHDLLVALELNLDDFIDGEYVGIFARGVRVALEERGFG